MRMKWFLEKCHFQWKYKWIIEIEYSNSGLLTKLWTSLTSKTMNKKWIPFSSSNISLEFLINYEADF